MAKFESVKIKKGDTVEVISGKNRGKKGKVIKLLVKKDKVLVERVNIIKRHQKPTKASQGGIVEKEAGIYVSNVALVCPKCDRGVRVGFKILSDGEKVRICRKCGEELGK
jgi:large subunit ribosomal protein L24